MRSSVFDDSGRIIGDLVVTGDFTVSGPTSTVSTTNTVVSDKLLELANGTSGTPSGDSGLIVERGSSSNAALVWDESTDSWRAATTSATGASTGDLTLTDAAVSCSSVTASGVVDITDTTDASDATGDTGALRCEGGASIAKRLYVGTDLDVDGTTNLDAVDVDGAVQVDNTLTVGIDDTGYDVKFYGATASAYMQWDASEDDLIVGGVARIVVPDGQLVLGSTAVSSTAAELNKLDGADVNVTAAKLSTLCALTNTEVGYVDGAGTSVVASKALVADANKDVGTIRNLTIDGTFTDGNYTFDTSGNVSGLGTVGCGAITTSGVLDITNTTDSSDDTGDTGALRCEGGASIAKKLYVGADLDVDGTTNLDAVDIDGAVQIDSTVTVGLNDTGYDVKFFGATAGAYMLWDEDADDLILAGAARLVVPDGQLVLASTAVSSTAAELNKLDGADVNVTAAKLSTLCALTNTEVGYSDGAGTSVVASKVLVADANKDVGTIRNLTIDGTFSDGNYTFDTSGNVSGLGTVGCGAITTSGVLDITDTTDATDATGDTGALRTEGGASIAKKAFVGTDLSVGGDIIIDDGGSLKEAGGTAALTFDGSGNVTKIGQDSPSSNEVLTWDGAKWVAAAAAGGTSANDLNLILHMTTFA